MKVWAWRAFEAEVSVAPGARKPVESAFTQTYSSDVEHVIRMGGPKLKVGAPPIRVEIIVKEIK